MSAGAERPRVAVSSCLLGEATRYDGTDRRAEALVADLGARFELVPVCPEVELGMGIPREPIQLYRGPAGILLLGRESGRDHTSSMREFAARRVAQLEAAGVAGCVLKRASPSCGLREAKLVEPDGTVTTRGRGLFAAALVARLPDLPVADEVELADPAVRTRFVEAVTARAAGRRAPPA